MNFGKDLTEMVRGGVVSRERRGDNGRWSWRRGRVLEGGGGGGGGGLS